MRATLLSAEEVLWTQELPTPPAVSVTRISNVWIIEWLHGSEKRTGRLLHEWMEQRRPGWSVYRRCQTKDDVLAEIRYAAHFAEANRSTPVLHLESHGCQDGLHDGSQDQDLLLWCELTGPLQSLNVATRCNLIVFVAACIGFAAIQALAEGPIAPAVALVGPTCELASNELFLGTKEFYRRLEDADAHFQGAAESSSREMTSADLEPESFVDLAYTAFIEQLIILHRKTEKTERDNRLRERMLAETKFSVGEIEARLKSLHTLSPKIAQSMWNTMFMIDRYPENEKRFGVDMALLVKKVAEFAECANGNT